MSKIINDIVFGKIEFDENSETGYSKKYIQAISKEISIQICNCEESKVKIPEIFRKIFIEFWDNYEKIEPQIAQQMLIFYQEDGIEWAANEMSVSGIIDALSKDLDPQKAVDEMDLQPQNINTLGEIRNTMSLIEL